ncbi:hypothetical protein FK545_01150 [Planococcus glaciei]|nr:hypothetical protein [Planococcus glaciei]QDY44632.1 hypothetical protein FK545_01150 [Planococcus glaciei]
MQVIVLRLDYQSSTIFEQLQQQAQNAASKQKAALPPHLTLQSFTHSNPLELKKAIEPWAVKMKQFFFVFRFARLLQTAGQFLRGTGCHQAISPNAFGTQPVDAGIYRAQCFLYAGSMGAPCNHYQSYRSAFLGATVCKAFHGVQALCGKGRCHRMLVCCPRKAQTEWSIFLLE